LSQGTAPSQQLATRLPSHIGQGVNLDASPTVTTKPGRSEYWQVGQITDFTLLRLRVAELYQTRLPDADPAITMVLTASNRDQHAVVDPYRSIARSPMSRSL
jgi:hypothetical protein